MTAGGARVDGIGTWRAIAVVLTAMLAAPNAVSAAEPRSNNTVAPSDRTSPTLAITPLWHTDLGESLILPLATRPQGELVVSTRSNRVGLLRDRQLLWWVSIESAILAVPAFVLKDGNVAALLRDGTLEVRSWLDGSLSHRGRISITDCQGTPSIGQHRDGTISVACGSRHLRIDSAGRCLSTDVIAHGPATMLAPHLIATSSGTWYWQRRWRAPNQITLEGGTVPVMSAMPNGGAPVRVLLDDSRVLRVEADGTWSYEIRSSRGRSESLAAIATDPSGAWLTLDTRGLVMRHRGDDSTMVGTIGQAPAAVVQFQRGAAPPVLHGVTSAIAVAGWPEQPLQVLMGDQNHTLAESRCNRMRQLEAAPAGNLYFACESGKIGVYSLH